MYEGIYEWTDRNQRMKIAAKFGVTSSHQVRRIIMGQCQNFELLAALIEQAEKNKALTERNEKLLQEYN